MKINPLGKSFAENYLKVSNRGASSPKREQGVRQDDSVTISPQASFLARVEEARDLTREEKIESIRKQVQEGSYVTDEKLSAAIDSAIDGVLEGL